MSMIPANSKCLVVGATNSSSIGFYAALNLLKAGASHVTIVGRDQTKLDESILILSRKINDDGDDGDDDDNKRNVSGVLGDLKKPETMAEVVENAREQMGGIDILVCSGGNGYSEYLGLDVKDPESYRMMQNVAVLSPMFLAEAAFPYLSKSTNAHGGTVVIVGSVSGKLRCFNRLDPSTRYDLYPNLTNICTRTTYIWNLFEHKQYIPSQCCLA